MTLPLPDKMTYGECYDPAITMTDPDEAKTYFEALVERNMRVTGKTSEEAESIERSNLGYYAGYHDDATRERVERLFCCAHPIFGAIATNGAPTAQAAFQAGVDSQN